MTAKSGTRSLRAGLLNAASAVAVVAAATLSAGTADAIMINNNYTPADAVDTGGGVNGVGQMIIDAGGGSVGLCTLSLINPRTVLFAAHCVNSRAATAYGNGGSTRIGAFFDVSNHTSGSSHVLNWLDLSGTLGTRGVTNASRFYYTMNQVQYNPRSLEADAGSFRYADIAIGTLDTPVVGIPTWAVLFSPLPVPDSIDPVTGTGYHVNITGYGGYGTGTSGPLTGNPPSDFRRRAAENMLGSLASLDTLQQWLFGQAPGVLTQQLYWIDFDSPNNAANASGRTSPYDFNVWRDDATTREGITAAGDSGGPLILDAANNTISSRDLILGVLSGGYTRFYTNTPANGYGTASFYQPLYLYWDYIAAANPYRYVSVLAGNGAWEDATRWTTMLDPNYVVINEAGAAVNGVPTAPGAGPAGDEPDFGQLCFQGSSGGSPAIDCLNMETGEETSELAAGSPDSSEGSYVGSADLSEFVPELSDGGAAEGTIGAPDFVSPDPQTIYLPGPLPAATLANGLPGATNFVANNITPSSSVIGRYFDVTLSAAGTTTLSSTVTIDRLRVASTAGLTVAGAGNLSSLIDVTQTGGTVLVNGRLRSVGDYSLMAGTIGGTGTIETPFLTSLLGAIAPGTSGIGSVGTLTVQGSAVLASGSGYFVEMASASSADRLNVTGALNLGGTFVASTIGGYTPAFGSSWTVANAAGGITGSFSSIATNLPGVLRPQVATVGNNVILSIIALPFANAASYTSPEQVEVATTLDQIRNTPGGYTALSNLFGSLDATSTSVLPTIMEALTPTNGILAQGVTEGTVGLMAGSVVDRNDQLIGGGGHGFDASGASAMLNASMLQATADPFDAMMMGSAVVVATQEAAAETAAKAASIRLREGWGGFLDISTMIDSTYEALPFPGDADLSGTIGTLGFDYGFSDGSFAGFAFSYGTSEADLTLPLQSVEADSWAITAYGGVHEGDSFLNGYLSYSGQTYDLSRTVPLMMGTQVLVATPDGNTFAAGAKLGINFGGSSSTFTPYASIDGKWINIDRYTETGGSAAMTVDAIDTALVDARLGLAYSGLFSTGTDSVLRPRLGVAYVIDVQSDANALNSAFAAFPSAPLTFVGSERDNGWVEYEAGVEFETTGFGLAVTYTGGDNGVLNYNTLSGRVSFSW